MLICPIETQSAGHAMTRLTNDIREKIATSVLRHRFSDDVAALMSSRAALANDIYCDVYRKQDREKLDAAPSGWFYEADRISAQFGELGSKYESIPFNGSLLARLGRVTDTPDKACRRVIDKHRSGCAKAYADSHKLSQRFLALKQKEADLKSALTTAERQLSTVLNSVATVKRLIEAWPEVEPFAKTFLDTPSKLPAIPAEKLNEILDLPVSETV